ncbi:hypothetical protein ACFLIM_05940 [Nonomuraea sp. M3C6]|uniref:Uncharacterized protein n=1 Tax=Nonomuraea marmarensis TaxID=3351344 RepID=A0ABW7A948_9ACTN
MRQKTLRADLGGQPRRIIHRYREGASNFHPAPTVVSVVGALMVPFLLLPSGMVPSRLRDLVFEPVAPDVVALEVVVPEVVVALAIDEEVPSFVVVEVVIEVVDVGFDVLTTPAGRRDHDPLLLMDDARRSLRHRARHRTRCRRRRPAGLDAGEARARSGYPLGEWKEHDTGDGAGKS